jgi:phenylalanyl-tRNA synthetase alpha chain
MSQDLVYKIEKIRKDFFFELSFVSDEITFQEVKKKYTAREGILFLISEDFKHCSLDEKKKVGGILLSLKEDINKALIEKKNRLFLDALSFPNEKEFDPSLSKKEFFHYSLHPYSESTQMISDFFQRMGFSVVEGPVLTNEYDNFTALNIPDNHPARDENDTFWIEKNTSLLRTHTSSIQVSEAKKREIPFGVISIGPVYRNEATDATHDFMFYQFEGMFFGQGASLSSLLFTMKSFLNAFFQKENLNVRARPGIFPFVEPGLEIDFECPFCFAGCAVCKYSQWIELGGAGMVHHFVKKHMGFSEDVLGWAFGMGLTRLIMLKYGISDIRNIHNSIIEN